MIDKLILAVISDITRAALKGLFDVSGEKRVALLNTVTGGHYPDVFFSFIKSVDEERFLQQLKGLKVRGVQSELLVAVRKFLVIEFSDYLSDKKCGGALETALVQMSKSSTRQSLDRAVRKFLSRFPGQKFYRIQTAVSVEDQDKHLLRKKLQQTAEFAHIEFAVDRRLLGGMRVFGNGKLTDQTWLKQVKKVTSNI
jgi:hypothetical protein